MNPAPDQTPIIRNIDLAGFSPEDRATLEEALAMAAERRWDVKRFAAVALVHESNLQRLYQGKYEGRVEQLVADIRRWVAAERHNVLVETEVVQQYRLVLDNCRAHSRMGVIVARNGRGKTLTADTWASQQPPGTAVRVQCPSRCSRADLVRLLLAALHVESGKNTEPEQERALFAAITSRYIIIVDEADALVQARRKSSPLRLLQDLHDAARVPIVLLFRPSAWTELCGGRHYRDDEQLIGRLLFRCVVPDRYLKSEVEAILSRFVPKVSPALRQIVRSALGCDDGGLRALVADLVSAARMADATGCPFEQALVSASGYRIRGGDWDETRNPSF